jgi:hypothetical protein
VVGLVVGPVVGPMVGPVVGPVVGSAEAEGLTERLARLADGLVLAALAAVLLTGARADVLACDGDGRAWGAVAVADRDICSAGDVAGLNVATDSIAPATRHTARMLASSGMTVPRATNGPKGPASRFSRFLRRFARSSRR